MIKIYITESTSGSSCPVFSITDKGEFTFDSYNGAPKNHSDWDRLGNYGMCGVYGYTKDFNILLDSFNLIMTEKPFVMATKEIFNLLKSNGVDVEEYRNEIKVEDGIKNLLLLKENIERCNFFEYKNGKYYTMKMDVISEADNMIKKLCEIHKSIINIIEDDNNIY